MPRGLAGDLPDYQGWLAKLRNERLEDASEKQWLQPFEAAHVIDVTISAISKAIAKGHLPAQRYGIRSWLIDRDDLDTFDRNRQRGRAYGSAGEPSKPPEEFPFSLEEVTAP